MKPQISSNNKMKQEKISSTFRSVVNILLLSFAAFFTGISLCNPETPKILQILMCLLFVAVIAVNLLCVVAQEKIIFTMKTVIDRQKKTIETQNNAVAE